MSLTIKYDELQNFMDEREKKMSLTKNKLTNLINVRKKTLQIINEVDIILKNYFIRESFNEHDKRIKPSDANYNMHKNRRIRYLYDVCDDEYIFIEYEKIMKLNERKMKVAKWFQQHEEFMFNSNIDRYS